MFSKKKNIKVSFQEAHRHITTIQVPDDIEIDMYRT